MKTLCISGSNRAGCTEYILKAISEQLGGELVLLKDKNISNCRGCLACHKNPACVLRDDMAEMTEKMIKSELIVFGVPNYFDNVTGLFKTFVDRLHPLYKNKTIVGKRIVFVFVAGGKEQGTEEVMLNATNGLVKYLEVDVVGVYTFKALNPPNIIAQKEKINDMISEIISKTS